ncbi:hypothetical protein KYT24_004364 [Salmonella enterica]|nr:hypothetical protein [Salmonella enterica]
MKLTTAERAATLAALEKQTDDNKRQKAELSPEVAAKVAKYEAGADQFAIHLCETITGKLPDDCTPEELTIAAGVVKETAILIAAAQAQLGRRTITPKH